MSLSHGQDRISHPARSRWAKLAPFFLVGPVSGPLLAGAVFNLKGGRPILGGLYCLALALFAILLPTEAARLLPTYAHLLHL